MRKYNIVLILVLFVVFKAKAQETDTYLTLEQAKMSALQNNNLLHIKNLKVKEQESKLKEANIKKFPVLSVNSTYQYNVNTGMLNIPAGTLGTLPLGGTNISLPAQDLGFPLGEHHTFNAGVSAYQPLTQLGKINTGINVVKIDHSIAQLENTKAAQQINNAVEQLYYGILALRKRKVEFEKNIKVAELKLYDVESALLSGKTININQAGLNANIAKEEQELLKLKFEEEDYLAEFKKLTGIDSEKFFFVEENDNTINTDNKSLKEYLLNASENNTDIQIVSLQKQKSELAIKASQQSNLPEIGLIGGYTYQKGNNIYPKNNPFIGANFKWNIQDLFSNKQTYNQSKLIQQQAVENEIYTQKQTVVSVEKAYRKLKQAEELIAVAKKAVNFRKQELKVEQDKRDAGLNKPINVLETEAALAKAESDLYAAKQAYMISISDINILTN